MKGFASLLLAGLASGLATVRPSCKDCTVSTIASGVVVNGSVPIDTSPETHFFNTTLQEINSTAWEYWYTDGVSESGDAAITVVFFRDPSLFTLGLGTLRVSVDAVWANGTRFNTMMLAENSNVTDCKHGVAGWENKGVWSGGSCTDCWFKSVDDRNFIVRIAGTGIDGSTIDGTFELTSFTHPRYPDGTTYPSKSASVELAPLIYWNEAIPAGKVETSFTLSGTELSFTGYGGFDRNWGPFNWDFVADHWWWVRIVTGPYSAVFWKYYSPISNHYHVDGYLEESGKILVKASSEDVGTGRDWATIQLKNETDGVRGSFPDDNTGFIIDFYSASTGGTWQFDVDHTNIVFEATGSNDEYTRFSNVATGGKLGGKQFAGIAKSEQNHIINIYPLP